MNDHDQPGLFDAASVAPPPTPAPGFRGITYHEHRARTLLNKIPGARPGGMAWTLNPYRGCTHACTYCFARDNHARLGLDTGEGFNTQVVVKTNAADVLRRELRGGKTGDDWVMVGTSTDCYQRAEGHYRLMPGILRTLTDHRVNFTTTTKSALLRRDIPLLAEAARVANVLVMTSLGSLDERVWRAFEPGAAPPRARLATIAALRAAGVAAGVLIAPVIPHAGDRPAALDALVDACAEAGAVTVYPDVMRISPGARDWFLTQSAAHLPPHLHQLLAASYANSRSMPASYVREVTAHLHARAARHGLPRWEDYIRDVSRRTPDSKSPRQRDR
ncbi:radical SAM protein [Streptomyces hesseae]|uniref:Radical SAM protein n=1 Tax=Streptomyces hesseae TaxID=3075519 RepID=A0ABU2SJY0_9ACTN|nr:radical SAM protein [Streptomyces sp. DSM 40473]MDT0449212.1 radical SAM protein [Streptomyces sp. DSM 40473]